MSKRVDHSANASPRRRGSPLSGEQTKTGFLDAAEKVFAQHGYEGATIRSIANEAGAQLGALHYYWGNKELMFQAVLERRLRPEAEERILRLDNLLIETKGKPKILEVLVAYYEPLLHTAQRDESGIFLKLVLRALTDPAPEVRRSLGRVSDEGAIRFIRMLRRACSHLEDVTFYARMPAVMGGMLYGICNRGPVERTVPPGEALPDLATSTYECIGAMAAMLAAPPFIDSTIVDGA